MDWTTGLSFFFVFFSFWHIFGQLVVAIATLNVKYAGEPVYLALSVILGLCAILSLGIIILYDYHLSYHEVQTIYTVHVYVVL